MSPVTFSSFRSAAARSIRSAFTENLAYKGVALFLSIVLWFLVERSLPSIEREYQVQLVLDQDSSLVRTSPLPTVQALVLGRDEPEMLPLSSQRPEVRLRFDADSPDSVVVRIGPGDVVLPPGVQGVSVRRVEPDSFVVIFDSLSQKMVPVVSALRVVAGEGITIAGAPRFEPDSVRLVGRRLALREINSITTIDRELVINDTGAVEVQIAPPPAGVEVIPDRVMVTVPVVKLLIPWP